MSRSVSCSCIMRPSELFFSNFIEVDASRSWRCSSLFCVMFMFIVEASASRAVSDVFISPRSLRTGSSLAEASADFPAKPLCSLTRSDISAPCSSSLYFFCSRAFLASASSFFICSSRSTMESESRLRSASTFSRRREASSLLALYLDTPAASSNISLRSSEVALSSFSTWPWSMIA